MAWPRFMIEALHFAWDAVSRCGFQYPPVDICAIACSLGVKKIEAREMTADGCLGIHDDGTMVLQYRISNSPLRNRFTIAHEVGHILLNQASGEAINGRIERRNRSHWKENAANRIAAELLMPDLWFQDCFSQYISKGKRPCWTTVREMAKIFDVSDDAIIFRILEVSRNPSVLFRISLNGIGPHFPYNQSENEPFRLARNTDYEIDRLWRESKRSRQHSVPIFGPFGPAEILCEGHTRTFSTRNGKSEQYWVIGWTVNDDNNYNEQASNTMGLL